MIARASAPVRIDYPKKWFVAGLCLYVSLVAVLVYLTLDSVEDFLRIVWMTVSVAVGVIFFLFLVPPLFTSHLAGQKGLRIRMGLLIDTVIPYVWIREVKETTIARASFGVGIGVKYSTHLATVFVTSGFRDLVVLRLDAAHFLGRRWRPKVSQIVMSVSDKDLFLETLGRNTIVREDAQDAPV